MQPDKRIGAHGPAAQAAVRIRERIIAKREQAAKRPGTMLCPRCEGQRYDQGSCPVCDNTGVVSDASTTGDRNA